MLKLAWKNGLFSPARTILNIVAVAAILAEILILEGFLSGTYTQLRDAVVLRGGDVIVGQSGINSFIASRSLLPQQTRAKVEAQPGVKAAAPLTSLPLIYESRGRLSPIVVMVYETRGGPQQIISGRAPEKSREIVIDKSLAKRYGLEPGDTMRLSAYDFTVTGIAKGAAALFTPFAFITYDGFFDFYADSNVGADMSSLSSLSFLLVDVAEGADPEQVAATIDANIPETDALLPIDLARNDENLGREMFGPILNLLLGLSYGIGALAIGLFSFAAVRSRKQSLGVLRALGFTTRRLMVSVVAEALGAVLLAIPLGILMAGGIANLIEYLSPVYLMQTNDPTGLWRTAIIAVALAIIGALAPLGALRRLEPAMAFKE